MTEDEFNKLAGAFLTAQAAKRMENSDEPSESEWREKIEELKSLMNCSDEEALDFMTTLYPCVSPS